MRCTVISRDANFADFSDLTKVIIMHVHALSTCSSPVSQYGYKSNDAIVAIVAMHVHITDNIIGNHASMGKMPLSN